MGHTCDDMVHGGGLVVMSAIAGSEKRAISNMKIGNHVLLLEYPTRINRIKPLFVFAGTWTVLPSTWLHVP